MGRRQTEATKRKLRCVANERERNGGQFADNAKPFARFRNTGGVLRDAKIGQHTVRYWPPGQTKSVPPNGEADAEAIEQLQRVNDAD